MTTATYSLFNTDINELHTKVEFSNNRITELEQELIKEREFKATVEAQIQKLQTLSAAGQSAYEQFLKAKELIKSQGSDEQYNEFMQLFTNDIAGYLPADNQEQTTSEVNDAETNKAQTSDNQEDENPQQHEEITTTIDVESTEVQPESDDQQGNSETSETYEPGLEIARQEVRDIVTHKLDGHKVRKLAKALNIEIANQKHTFLRNEILLIIDNAESVKHLANIQTHISNL